MKRCLIVDDEKNAHYVIKNHMNAFPQLELVGHVYNVAAAITFLKEHLVDVIFLDIQMPGADGFSLMPYLHKGQAVILTTAFSEYALKSYDYQVLDYLLKPISFERFSISVERIMDSETKLLPAESLSFKVDNEIQEFQMEDIQYIQSWGNYIKLFTSDESFICNSTTTEALSKLPKERFIRIHKSYIVNLDYIVDYHTDYVSLKTQVLIPVGITYRRNVMEIKGL